MGFSVDFFIDVAIVFKDRHGNPAPVDGVPVWSNDREDLCTVVPSLDGMSARIQPLGPMGGALISAVGDADLDATGFKAVTISGLLDLTGGQASTGAMQFTPSTDAAP